MASCLGCYYGTKGWGDGVWGRSCRHSLPCPSSSTVHLLQVTDPITEVASLPCTVVQSAEHGAWASTWVLVTAQIASIGPNCRRTTDTDKALRGSRATHANMASRDSTTQGHHHGFRRQHRPLTSAWSSAQHTHCSVFPSFPSPSHVRSSRCWRWVRGWLRTRGDRE